MSEPTWLDVDEVVDMHAEQLAIFGGPEAFGIEAFWSLRF